VHDIHITPISFHTEFTEQVERRTNKMPPKRARKEIDGNDSDHDKDSNFVPSDEDYDPGEDYVPSKTSASKNTVVFVVDSRYAEVRIVGKNLSEAPKNQRTIINKP
jgi:hypothetical protein